MLRLREYVPQRVKVLTVPVLPRHFAAQHSVQPRTVAAGGEVERHRAGQRIQQSHAPGVNIVPRALKIARVPRVVDRLARTPGIVEEVVYLPLRVSGVKAVEVPSVLLVHADDEVKARVVIAAHLARTVGSAVDPVRGEHTPRRRVNAVAQLLRARRGGGDLKLVLQPRAVHEVFHYILRRRTAADVAMADEKYPRHVLPLS